MVSGLAAKSCRLASSHDPPEAIGGASVQALIQALLADAELLSQFVDSGFGIFEPAEYQRLHEVGSGDLPLSPDHGRFLSRLGSTGREQSLQSTWPVFLW